MNRLKIATFLFLTCIFTAASQSKKSEEISKWTIKNCVNQFSMDKAIPTKAGYHYWFADKDFLNGRTLKLSVIKPYDSTHPPHKHTEDEFFFVLEGKAKFHLNGDSVIAEPYASFYCPAMSLHSISNAGDTELKYLVIKDYKMDK